MTHGKLWLNLMPELPQDIEHQKMLHGFLELLVAIARVWHMDDETEEFIEETSDISWTDVEWQDMDSPSMERIQDYTNIMVCVTRETKVEDDTANETEKKAEDDELRKGWNRRHWSQAGLYY